MQNFLVLLIVFLTSTMASAGEKFQGTLTLNAPTSFSDKKLKLQVIEAGTYQVVASSDYMMTDTLKIKTPKKTFDFPFQAGFSYYGLWFFKDVTVTPEDLKQSFGLQIASTVSVTAPSQVVKNADCHMSVYPGYYTHTICRPDGDGGEDCTPEQFEYDDGSVDEIYVSKQSVITMQFNFKIIDPTTQAVLGTLSFGKVSKGKNEIFPAGPCVLKPQS